MFFGIFDRHIEPPAKPKIEPMLKPEPKPMPKTVKTVGLMIRHVWDLEENGETELAKKYWKIIAEQCEFYAER